MTADARAGIIIPARHEEQALRKQDAESDTFHGVYAPAGAPKPIIDRLAKELDAILARSDVREKFAKIGLPVVAEGPDGCRARIAREVPMCKEIIDNAGLKMR
jgi:tripartite-type tricarboxylate transporter receptor subunit TctC